MPEILSPLAPFLLIFFALVLGRFLKKQLARRESWEMFHPSPEKTGERLEKLRQAGLNSLEEFNALCQKLHALRHKNELKSLNQSNTALFPEKTLLRVFLQGNPEEEVIPERLGLVRVETPPQLLRFFTFIDQADLEPYRRLADISFSKLLLEDKANLLRALFTRELLDHVIEYLNMTLPARLQVYVS